MFDRNGGEDSEVGRIPWQEVFLCLGERPQVTQTGLEHLILLPSPPSAWTTDVCCHLWFYVVLDRIQGFEYLVLGKYSTD